MRLDESNESKHRTVRLKGLETHFCFSLTSSMALLADGCLYRSSHSVSFCALGEVNVYMFDHQKKYES